jgi:hypothetical protein
MHSAIQAAASAGRAAQRSRDPSTLRVFLSWVRREREVAQGVEAQPPRLPRRVLDVLSRDELARLEDCARTERGKLIACRSSVQETAGHETGQAAIRTEDDANHTAGHAACT